MQKSVKQWSTRTVLAGTLILSALPLVAVEMFPAQLKFVMEPAPYIVFHNIAEFFSIMVSLSMFGVGWFTYDQSKDRHALFLGTAFLGIGLMDFMHSMSAPTSHVLDLLFEPTATLAGKERVSKAPITYLNRLMLKRRFRKAVDAKVTRERTFTGAEETKKGGIKRLFLFFAILAVILVVRFTGATQYLQQETLRQWIQGYGILAPGSSIFSWQ